MLQDVYFDDESAEVVISSLRLGDDQDRYYLIVIINLVLLLNPIPSTAVVLIVFLTISFFL